MGRSLRNFVYLLVAVGGLTFVSGLVFAQSPGALPIPVHISSGATYPTGLQSVVTFDARGAPAAANNAGYYSRPVLVSNNTLGQLGKGLLRRAVPVAAMIAAVEAAGWAIDELSQQVMDGVPQPSGAPAGSSYWSFDGKVFPSSAAAGAYQVAKFSPTTGARYSGLINCGGPQVNGNISCQIKIEFSYPGFNAYAITHVANNTPGAYTAYSFPPAQPLPVADALIGAMVAANPALAQQALHNADGSVNRNPDVMAAAQALAAQLASTDPTQQPDPVGEWNTGQQAGPNTGQAAAEFPGFCGWATAVCDAIDWMRDESDPVGDQDVPEIVPDLSATQWSSGLGGGSCPPDVVVANVMGGEVVFPLSGFCAAAEIIRPIVVAGAALLALFIVGGYRRG